MSIVVEGLRKRFGKRGALDGISHAFPSGGLTALVGPSGCGKTTLLRLIAGLERPDAGRVFMDGVEITDAPLRERRVGFVYQQYALFPHLTVAQNIGFGLAARHRPRAEIAARVEELLELVRLDGYEKRFPRELSGGERQRIALARALASDPRSLLLDEPFSALDVHVRKHLRRRLRELHERSNLTTIVVTHDTDEAMEIADHLVVLRAGSLQQAGSPSELYERPANPFVVQFIGGANLLRLDGMEGEIAYVRMRDLRIEREAFELGVAASVRRIVDLGDRVRVEVCREDGQEMTVEIDTARAQRLALTYGASVWIAATRAHRFETAA